MLLVTTCRKPCANTRKFAKTLALCVPSSKMENRGKKNMEDIIDEARHLGFRRIAVINEQKGNPHRIEVMGLDKTDWQWMEAIGIHGYSAKKIAEPVGSLRIEGPKRAKLAVLFDIEEDEEAETVLQTDGELIFKNKETLLKVKW